MSADHHPRYITTSDDMWILDTWYCFREVYRTPRYDLGIRGYEVPPAAKEVTREKCAAWNAEHDAWLAAG